MLTSIEYPHQRICSTKLHPRPRRAVKSIAAIPLSLAALLCTSGAAIAAGAPLSKDDLMAKGEEVYNQTCAGCHQASGMGLPGSYPPLIEGAAFDAAPFVTQPLEERGFWKDGKMQLGSMKNQMEAVINGIPNSRMFAFGGQLDDAEIAAVVTYVRNAWGNDSGDVVQPAQVKAAR